MFALIFGLFLLAVALVFRDYAAQDEYVEDFEGARENSLVAAGCVFVAVIFLGIGIGGM